MSVRYINLPTTTTQSQSPHMLYIGSTGSGKSNGAEYALEGAFLRGEKCIDFDSSMRFENTTASLEERDPNLIKLMASHPLLWHKYDGQPNSFNDEVLLICGRGIVNFPELPNNFRIVSFRQEDLKWEQLHDLLGGTESLRHLMNSLEARFGNRLTMKDLSDIVLHRKFRGEHVNPGKVTEQQRNMIRNRINSWLQTGLFSDTVEKINFQEILNNNKVMTCFNTMLCEEQWEEGVAYSIILDNIINTVKSRKVDKVVRLYIREVHDYMNWKVCKDHIIKIARKGRKLGKTAIKLILDTQRGNDLPPVLREQMGYIMQMRTSLAEAKKLLDRQNIPLSEIYKIDRYQPGECLVLSTQRWDKIQIPPTRHMHMNNNDKMLKLLAEKHKGMKHWDWESIINFEPELEDIPEEKKKGDEFDDW